MKSHYLLLFIIFTLLYGCTGKKSRTNVFDEESRTPIILALENITTQTGKESLSSLNADIEYIALETTNQSLISGVSKIIKLANGNLIVGDGDRIRMFDPSGKFIRPVSQMGNGPADHARRFHPVSNPQTGGFFLLTGKKVIEFDATGEYINNFEIEDRLLQMVLDPVEDNLILHRMNIPKAPADTAPTWFLFCYDFQGKEINRYEDITPRPGGEGIIPIVTPIRPLYTYKSKIRFNEFGNDTLFNIEKEGLIPFAIMSLGDMRMSASPKGGNAEMDAVFSSLKEKLFLGFFMEDDQFFYMVFGWGFGGEYLYATYNKQTGQVINQGNGGYLSFTEGLDNDIDGGLSFFPYTVLPDGSRIQWKTAEEFKENILKKNYEENKKLYGNKFEKVHQLAQSLDDDDNPVLIIIK